MSILRKPYKRIEIPYASFLSGGVIFTETNSFLFRQITLQDSGSHIFEVSVASIGLVFGNFHRFI